MGKFNTKNGNFAKKHKVDEAFTHLSKEIKQNQTLCEKQL